MVNNSKESLSIKVVAVIFIVGVVVSTLALAGAIEQSQYFYKTTQFILGFIGFFICLFGLIILDKPSRFTQIPIALTVCILSLIYDKTDYDPKNAEACYDLYIDCDESYRELFEYTCHSWKNYCNDGHGWFID